MPTYEVQWSVSLDADSPAEAARQAFEGHREADVRYVVDGEFADSARVIAVGYLARCWWCNGAIDTEHDDYETCFCDNLTGHVDCPEPCACLHPVQCGCMDDPRLDVEDDEGVLA
jgi:hypothetical protein